MSKQSIILLGVGSFNPPTIMHLRIMELAKDFLSKTGRFHVLGGVLSPVHDGYGKKDLAPAKHRLEMTKIALEKNSWVKLSTWEASNTQWTRTRAVMDYHQNRLDSYTQGNMEEKDAWMPSQMDRGTGVKCKMVCGADVLETFNVPGLWNEEDAGVRYNIEESSMRTTDVLLGKTLSLGRDYGLVVISREGNDPYKSIYNCDILHEHKANIHVVHEWLSNEISSTRIRRALRRHESVRYVVPDPVIDYIQKERLYQAI